MCESNVVFLESSSINIVLYYLYVSIIDKFLWENQVISNIIVSYLKCHVIRKSSDQIIAWRGCL